MNENEIIAPLLNSVNKAAIPPELKERIVLRLNQLGKLTQSPSFLPEIDSLTRYIDWVINMPWSARTEDVLDLKHAKEVLTKSHYGLAPLKQRILEYIAVMQMTSKSSEGKVRSPILCFVGLVGTGKTTFAMSIADALSRKMVRIPFGGMGSARDLRGGSRFQAEAEPGKVMKGLRVAGSKNPVILLDEIDRVTDEGRSSIMGVLVELLDPKQNNAFVDQYIDYPFDLSEAIFVATANNTTHIATAVMDRLEPIMMPSYNDEEKIVIAKSYILPRALADSGMGKNTIQFDDDVWAQIARPLGYDAGIRTLERTIKGIVRKVALMVAEGKAQSVHLTNENIKEYLPTW